MTAPEYLTLQFFNVSGETLKLEQLGSDFLKENQIESSRYGDGLKVAILRKDSKAGNPYYEYSQNGLPLPEGLSTLMKIEGTLITFGKVRLSKSGHPKKEGEAQVLVGSSIYKITAYITESKMPFYVKVVAHKKPDTANNIIKAQKSIKGGRII